MKAEIRWPTALIDVSEAKLGDLLIVSHGHNELLVFTCGTAGREIAIVLAEFAPRSDFLVPEAVGFGTIVEQGDTVRRFGAGLKIEPLEREPLAAAPLRVAQNPVLGLGEIVGGERGLYVRCAGLNGWGVFDLASGEAIQLKEPPLVRAFRLRWYDGDDFIELMDSVTAIRKREFRKA